jgi:sensor histidine kinase regulating citrate/malate metabolism
MSWAMPGAVARVIPWWFWPVLLVSTGLIIAAARWGFRLYLYRLIDRRIDVYQNDLVAKHCEEVQNIYREMRGWRHDYHNHIQTLKAYRAEGEDERLDQYLVELDADLTGVDRLIKSGNVMVDAILNSKLSLAKSRRIKIDAKALTPEELTISKIDLCVIIGNLLDNAMEACAALDENERFIRVYIDVKRGHLYLSVTNSSRGRAARQKGRYISAKGGFHGLGLLRIDRLVDKYGGYIKRRDEEGVFTSEIMLSLAKTP